MSINTQGKPCSDLGRVLVLNDPPVRYMMQTMSRYVDSQNIVFPDPFASFIRLVRLINIDVGIMPSTACVVKFDFYDVMTMWSLLPLVVVGIGVLRVAFLKLQLTARTLRRKPSADDNGKAGRADHHKFHRGVESAMAGAMLVVCIFHSSVGQCRLTQ